MMGKSRIPSHSSEVSVEKSRASAMSRASDPAIFVALDVDDPKRAEALAEQLSGHGFGFKLGPRLMLREGAGLIRSIARHGEVFVDCKHLDIPTTMIAAVRAAFESGARYSTIHASCGPKAIQSLQALCQDFSGHRVLAVTVLTSFEPATLPFAWKGISIPEIVSGLARECADHGHRAFVCSPHEVESLKQMIPDGYFVTPGVRPTGFAKGDQVRVETPAQAARSGASSLVVGRPIIEAADPLAVALQMQQEFLSALSTP